MSGHGAGVHPELAAVPTVAEPTAPAVVTPLHPLALDLISPRQAIICGRPTLHRGVSRLLADPNIACVRTDHRPRWPDVSGNVYATGTRAEVTGAPPRHGSNTAPTLSTRWSPRSTPNSTYPATPPDCMWRGRCRRHCGPVTSWWWGEQPDPRHRARRPRQSRSPGAVEPGVAGIDGTNSTAIGAALDLQSRDPVPAPSRSWAI